MQVRSTSFSVFERLVDIHFLPDVFLFGTVNGIYFRCVQAGHFFPAANIIIKNIIGNAVEPR